METQETVNQEATTDEKLFNQVELDKIVSERLKREREKYSDYDVLKQKAAQLDKIDEESKSELQKAQERADALDAELKALKRNTEVRDIREKVAKETGIPINLLTAETEETCKEQANAILEYKQTIYPAVRDGGELPKAIGKGKTRDQFAEWFSTNMEL